MTATAPSATASWTPFTALFSTLQELAQLVPLALHSPRQFEVSCDVDGHGATTLNLDGKDEEAVVALFDRMTDGRHANLFLSPAFARQVELWRNTFGQRLPHGERLPYYEDNDLVWSASNFEGSWWVVTPQAA